MNEDMSAENQPHDTGKSERDTQPISPQLLKLATEGSSFAQLPDSTQDLYQYDARVGSGVTGRPPFTPGSAPLPERPTPKGHGGRNLLIAGGAAVASAAVVIGGFFGIDKLRGSNQNPDTNPGSAGPPTLTVEPTNTQTPTETVIPSPTATNTPEATSTPMPVIEALPKVEPKSIDKYPYELGYKKTYGNVTLAITKEMQNRIECRDLSSDLMKPCPNMQEVYLNTQDFPDAEQKLNEAVMIAKYEAYMRGKDGNNPIDPSTLSFSQFKEDILNGKKYEMSIKALINGTNTIGNATIDLSKPLAVIWLGNPQPFQENFYVLSQGFSVSMRVIDGELYVEFFDSSASGKDSTKASLLQPYKWSASSLLTTSLTLINDASQKQFERQRPISIVGEGITRIQNLNNKMIPYTMPVYNSSERNGILRVR